MKKKKDTVKKSTKTVSKKISSKKEAPEIKKEDNNPDVVRIVITETEEDIVLDSGFTGDPESLKEDIKKEAAKGKIISRFLIPLFTFLAIGLVAGGLTWYYARPELTSKKSQEEKIETPPQVQNTQTPSQPAQTNSQPAKVTPQPTTYTVQSGDTLSSIANSHNLTSKQLADYNGITNADSLTIGQVLKIPPTQ